MIRNNFVYKVLALVFALIMWFYVNSERNPNQFARKDFTGIAIKKINVAKGYSADLSADEVAVSIKGPKSMLDKISKINSFVNLNKIAPNMKAVVITELIGLSDEEKSRLSVSVSPKIVDARISVITGKLFPVQVMTESAAPIGYEYSSMDVDPSTVKVSGKHSIVSKVREVIIQLPKQNRVVTGFEKKFDLQARDENGKEVNGITITPQKANLKVSFSTINARKTVLVTPDIVGKPNDAAIVESISVTPKSFVVEGKLNDLADLSIIHTEPVSIENLSETATKEVSLKDIPSGINVIGRERVKVTVKIKIPN